MANKLGIVTRYRADESTHVAIQLADFYHHQGWDISIFARPGHAPHVYPDWDSKVRRYGNYPYVYWLDQQSHVIWLEAISPFETVYANDAGIASCLVLPNDVNTEQMCEGHTRRPDVTLTLSKHVSMNLAKKMAHGWPNTQLSLVAPVPPVLPYQSIKGPVTIGVLLMDSQALRTTLGIFKLLRRLLATNPDLHVRVLTSGSWRKTSKKLLKRMATAYPGRFWVCQAIDWATRQSFLVGCHLSLWVPHKEGFGTAALFSLACSVPVVAWNCPSSAELVSDNCGVLVKCQTTPSNLSWEVEPNYPEMERELLKLLKNRAKLESLAEGCLREVPASLS